MTVQYSAVVRPRPVRFSQPHHRPAPQTPKLLSCTRVTLLDTETFTVLDGWDEIILRFHRIDDVWYCDRSRDGLTTQICLSDGSYPRHHEPTSEGWLVWATAVLQDTHALKIQFTQSRGAGLILLSHAYGMV